MKFSFHWASLLMVLLSGTLHAQEYNLDQLVELALKNSFEIQSATLDEKKTSAKIDEVKARLLPSFNISGDYKGYFKIPGQVVPASTFGGPEGSYTTLALGLPYNLSTSAQVSQTLFNPSVRFALKAANLSRDLTALSTVKTKEDIAYNVAYAYYNLVMLKQQIAFLDTNLVSQDRLYKISNLLYQNQMAQGIDKDRILINKTATETQLASVRDSYNQIANLLKLYTGLPQSDTIRIVVTVSNDMLNPGKTVYEPLRRTEVKLLERQKDLNELDGRNIKAGFIPTVSAYGVANLAYYGKGGENSVLKAVPGYWAGLQLNWNVFDGFARKAKATQNRIDTEKLNVQIRQLEETFQMEEANAQSKFTVEQKNIRSKSDQVRLAERVYKQTQLQFKEGTVSLTDVIQAENTLNEAQTNYLTSLVQLLQAELDWKKATGALLEK
ncbi:hypothetical protein DYBT9275_01344 [Dyadobacter sp. CECT 9275]|uniref:Outer membrane protein TolC n=1 Tax=Dyadobacter helix TaxID=2822344 RepID=A0A916J968_9BACT|nr:TolC family protein [Dyadobacter sp. CECT 9275]CAG4994206.1 hypothetical protein DYBT9275_01344 [Dyadobacter sp. CECT 9275]